MADKLVLHEDALREYLGRISGVCHILESIPAFLKGENKEGQSIYLTEAELGNHEPFHTAWKEICDSRMSESKQVANFLTHNRAKLVKAAEAITNTDMDAAATFPRTEVPGSHARSTLESTVERRGIDVDSHDDHVRDQHQESEFLAKMFICAEHFGALPKFKKLLGSAMRLRPDKVLTVARLLDSLSLVYDDTGNYAKAYRNELERHGDFVGRAADGYYAEFDALVGYLHKGDTSAKQLAENTSDLMAKFAEALIDWRQDFAAAIRLMAEHDRNEAAVAAKELTLSLISDNPYEAARNTLNAMLDAWERADSQGRANDATLRKFSEDRGFGLDDPQHDDVSRHDVVLPDPWDGKL
jgi:hypothetical protein